MRCISCKGVFHPATGCQYSETAAVCGMCTRNFWDWVRTHTNVMKRVGPKGSKRYVSFYEAATKELRS